MIDVRAERGAAVPIKPTLEIKHVVAVASGKGGVGKSTVTAKLARALVKLGYRVGVLDADVYGPSMPRLLGVGDAEVEPLEGDLLRPVETQGIKLMSLGFFVSPSDAMLWRGMMASNAIKQLVQQTAWGALDFLLIDLPPGTGDVHLSMISEIKIDGAVIVSTPSPLAVDDVRRGVEMFRNKNVEIPVLGLVENMAWFTPLLHPTEKYYLFGCGGAREFALQNGIEVLGEVPLLEDMAVGPYFQQIAKKVVDKMEKSR